MNQLLKSVILVNIVFIVIFGIFTTIGLLYENYTANYYSQEEISSMHAQGQLVAVPKGPLFVLGQGLFYIFMFILPIFVIIISGIYQLKNLNLKEYGESLLIPLSYILIAFLGTLLWGSLTNISGEEGMIFAYFWLQFAITFAAVAIVNLIIYFIKKY